MHTFSAQCDKNEEFSKCGSNGCQATCENPDLPTRCRAMCIPGCVCSEGFIKNSNGRCIPIEKCPKSKKWFFNYCIKTLHFIFLFLTFRPISAQCDKNEEYQACGIGGCQATCENPDLPTICLPPGCSPGCYCKEGFIRASNGRCIPKDKCPKSRKSIIRS